MSPGADGFSQRRTTLFGDMTEDLTFYDYLVLRVRGAGDPRTRHGLFVNVQTADAFHDELWQHKLETLRNDGGWEDVYVRRSAYPRRSAHTAPSCLWTSSS